jgi:hypothetical protein
VPEVPPDDVVPVAEPPDDDDEPDDVVPDVEPELPGVEPVEPDGVDELVDDGAVVVVVDGVVELDEGDLVVVDEPFGVVVCGLVVVELDGVDGVVGAGLDWLSLTSPPSEVVVPAGVEPPTIPDSGFFARASTTVTAVMDRTNTTTVATAMLRQRSEPTRRRRLDHHASMVAPGSPPVRPAPPRGGGRGGGGGGGGAPGPRPDGIGAGPKRPGGGTLTKGSRTGASLVSSGSAPSTPVPPDERPETRAPLPTRVRTVAAGCFAIIHGDGSETSGLASNIYSVS